jgi:hypothetical protein
MGEPHAPQLTNCLGKEEDGWRQHVPDLCEPPIGGVAQERRGGADGCLTHTYSLTERCKSCAAVQSYAISPSPSFLATLPPISITAVEAASR